MQLVLIRHGEPDYAPCDARGFLGHGRDLAPLSPAGVRQAEAAAEQCTLAGAQLILASPYTRALQTAAILSRRLGLPLTVEIDLHEWLPDKTFQYRTSEESFALHDDSYACRGVYPPGETRRWESVDEIISRTKGVLNRYLGRFDKLIVVSHGGVMRRLTGLHDIAYCKPYEVTYTAEFPFYHWVD